MTSSSTWRRASWTGCCSSSSAGARCAGAGGAPRKGTLHVARGAGGARRRTRGRKRRGGCTRSRVHPPLSDFCERMFHVKHSTSRIRKQLRRAQPLWTSLRRCGGPRTKAPCWRGVGLVSARCWSRAGAVLERCKKRRVVAKGRTSPAAVSVLCEIECPFVTEPRWIRVGSVSKPRCASARMRSAGQPARPSPPTDIAPMFHVKHRGGRTRKHPVRLGRCTRLRTWPHVPVPDSCWTRVGPVPDPCRRAVEPV